MQDLHFDAPWRSYSSTKVHNRRLLSGHIAVNPRNQWFFHAAALEGTDALYLFSVALLLVDRDRG